MGDKAVPCDFMGCPFRTQHRDKMKRHLRQRHAKGDDFERILDSYVDGLMPGE